MDGLTRIDHYIERRSISDVSFCCFSDFCRPNATNFNRTIDIPERAVTIVC